MNNNYNRRKSDRFLNLTIILCLIAGMLLGWVGTKLYSDVTQNTDKYNTPDIKIQLVKTFTDQLNENQISPIDGSPAELAKRLEVKAASINGDVYLVICDRKSGVEFIRGQKSGFLKLSDNCNDSQNNNK